MSNEILQGNVKIAEFMGWKKERVKYTNNIADPGIWIYHSGGKGRRAKDELEFHSSWDWLMPVVEKIEKELNGEVCIYHTCCDIGVYPEGFDSSNTIASTVYPEAKSKIEAAWITIIKFIDWYTLNVTPS